MLFLDDCCNFHIPNTNSKQNIYRKNLAANSAGGGMGATRGAGCYLVSKKCASKITYNIQTYYYNGIHKVDDQIDFWLNNVFRRNNFNIYCIKFHLKVLYFYKSSFLYFLLFMLIKIM